MPIVEDDDEVKVKRIYKELENIIEKVIKEENLIVLGNQNTTINEGKELLVNMDFEKGMSEEISMQNFATDTITNCTIMINHPRRRYMWKTSRDRRRM